MKRKKKRRNSSSLDHSINETPQSIRSKVEKTKKIKDYFLIIKRIIWKKNNKKQFIYLFI